MPAYFHLATHVRDIDEARNFYTEVLGCSVGRQATRWIDLNFFGHQLSLHLGEPTHGSDGTDGERSVPMPHFGAILPLDEWHALKATLEQHGTDFVIPPTVRFEGKAGEQRTMFFRDPSGNAIEIKGFAQTEDIFDAS